jgi:hypothetical protein
MHYHEERQQMCFLMTLGTWNIDVDARVDLNRGSASMQVAVPITASHFPLFSSDTWDTKRVPHLWYPRLIQWTLLKGYAVKSVLKRSLSVSEDQLLMQLILTWSIHLIFLCPQGNLYKHFRLIWCEIQVACWKINSILMHRSISPQDERSM